MTPTTKAPTGPTGKVRVSRFAGVFECNCAHPTQDAMYGRGKRLFNPAGKPGAYTRRCTVCGRVIASKD